MTTIEGIDYGFAPHPDPAAIRASGAKFAGRYLAAEAPLGGDGGKLLSAAEKDALTAAGLSVVLFHEWAADWTLGGFTAGQDAARSDQKQLAQLGMAGTPVYLSADFDATPAQQEPVNACLQGYASVRGWAMTGIYGGFWVVARARQALPQLTWTCGTPAWSGDNWQTCGWKPVIMQGPQVSVGGCLVDWDTAYAPDYGQWPRPPRGPYRHVTDGKTTLADIIAARRTTAAHILAVSAAAYTAADEQAIAGLVLPANFPFYTSNP